MLRAVLKPLAPLHLIFPPLYTYLVETAAIKKAVGCQGPSSLHIEVWDLTGWASALPFAEFLALSSLCDLFIIVAALSRALGKRAK